MSRTKTPQRKPQRSLQTILIVWFVLFSVVPLAFVTGYSVIKYENAIDHELSQRLAGNAREISVVLNDFQTGLTSQRDRFIKDPNLVYHLSVGDLTALKSIAYNWARADFSTTLSFFSRDGRLLQSVVKDQKGEVVDFNPAPGSTLYISKANLEKLQYAKEFFFIEFNKKAISLIVISKITNNQRRHIGYVEQVLSLDEGFLEKLKTRMKLELVILRSNGQVVSASHPDFYLYRADVFEEKIKSESAFFELKVRTDPYGFILYPLKWGTSDFYLLLGASKVKAEEVLRNVNYAFYSVVGAVILLLVITIFFTSRTILRPLNELVAATENLHSLERPLEMPIKSDTEIGLLTESFNEMSRNVVQARVDLRKQIKEVEKAYAEMQEAQTKLVHSSKMVSLGQLVAGVAHELNNPIGFIYSNMTHLREYSDKLLQLADVAEKHPDQVAELKQQLDIDFIRKDLPKLISSCEDGARRTRDIVLGLRNFSRLEESKTKEIDIHLAIDNTLNLLAGEIKNRIEVVKEYGNVPFVSCYASEINQVIMNILSNAVQAINGPGHIWIKTKVVKKGKKDLVQISFQDSGQGMSVEVMEKIFDPFFSTKGVGQGTGLGLSISYGIVQNHGGDIQVKSQIGVGTEFIVTIPLKAEVMTTTGPVPELKVNGIVKDQKS